MGNKLFMSPIANNNPDRHEDPEFWKNLALQCGSTGDFSPYWREMQSSKEWKEAGPQKKQQMQKMVRMMEAKVNNFQVSMMQNQLNHDANMMNTMHNTFQEVNDR